MKHMAAQKNNTEDIWFATVSDDYVFNVDAVKLKRRVIAPYTDPNAAPKCNPPRKAAFAISRKPPILGGGATMRKSRFSDSQIMTILKKAESGVPVSEICREIADWLIRLTTTYRRWGCGLCFQYLRNVKGFEWNHKRVYRIERFNRTARHEWLDLYHFDSIKQAQSLATQWLWHQLQMGGLHNVRN